VSSVPHLSFAFDLRSSPTGPSHAELVTAVLDICGWADNLDEVTSSVMIPEHHISTDGYVPSPIVLAAAIAGRTSRVQLSIMVIAPLYHPLRVAEDLAMLDLISQGRTTFILGGGYRPVEFSAFGVKMEDRGSLVEETLIVLDQAWSGESFQFRGEDVQILPRPMQRPRPPIVLGGGSKAAARRAARLADGFLPMDPTLMQTYYDELASLGKAIPESPSHPGGAETIVAVSQDPDWTWQQVAPHCLHEINIYADWLRAGTSGSGVDTSFFEVADADALRALGRYLVLTPEECIEKMRYQDGTLSLAPLTGGISPEVASETIRLIESRVLPNL